MDRLEDKGKKTAKTLLLFNLPSKEDVLGLVSLHTSASFLFADSLMVVLLLQYR